MRSRFVNGMVFLDFHVEIDVERLRSYRERRRSLIGGLSIRTVFLIMPARGSGPRRPSRGVRNR